MPGVVALFIVPLLVTVEETLESELYDPNGIAELLEISGFHQEQPE